MHQQEPHPALTSGARVLLRGGKERIFCCNEDGSKYRIWRVDTPSGRPVPDDAAKKSDIVKVLDDD